MPRRKSRREPGRPTLLDKDVEEKLVEATKIGTPMAIAAAYCGISERAFQEWMRRGHTERAAREEGQEPDPVEQKYLDLYEKVTKARAAATVTSAMLIRKAAVGGQVTEETTRRYRDHEGQVVEEKTVKKTAPDWRASAFWLERQERGHFGKSLDIDQTINGKVEVAVDMGELASRVQKNLAELTAAAGELTAGPADPGDADVVDAVIDDTPNGG